MLDRYGAIVPRRVQNCDSSLEFSFGNFPCEAICHWLTRVISQLLKQGTVATIMPVPVCSNLICKSAIKINDVYYYQVRIAVFYSILS
jgi:hypothetical protein